MPPRTSDLPPSQMRCTVDFDRDGVQHGLLRLPFSRDDSAWGSVVTPIAVIGNGDGPTALLTGGNHGDEYEGPVALFNLARTLDPARVRGRVIIVPAMNYPAFRAGRRTSPIDAGNLNRSFPGRPDGTVTEKIADYFQRFLLPLADYVLDYHSGGRTLDFIPFAAVHEREDKVLQAACEAAMDAFGAPYGVLLRELDSVGMYDTEAEAMGKVFVSTELGGGGSATPDSIRIAERGARNLLRHAGILDEPVERSAGLRLTMPDEACFTIAEEAGLLEPCFELGERVTRGDVLMRIHPIERTGGVPVDYRAGLSGLLAGRHFPGLVQAGDCLAVVAVPAS